jgi:hypothetical protein
MQISIVRHLTGAQIFDQDPRLNGGPFNGPGLAARDLMLELVEHHIF